MFKKLSRLIFGQAKNPFAHDVRQRIALVAVMAWIGLGSDGLSSANYGPEEAFKAISHAPMLGLYLAIMIAVTVFIIAGAYNQVIELFPNGGGGYKAANRLLNPTAGLISGSALVVDYILTIAISLAAAVDAIFSLLPAGYSVDTIYIKVFVVIVLTALNLRGMKESIRILLPIFLGFLITHVVLLIYGLVLHASDIHEVLSGTIQQTHHMVNSIGLMAVAIMLLKAYSIGSGTFTGLEAVSNNVNVLAEPRVRTGKWTMFYMAVSLSFMAGMITFMYMLWHVSYVPGQTYNAILFNSILSHLPHHHWLLMIVLAFEAGILLLGANTGFLGGPAVLANMAVDQWAPSTFGNLSSRLVKQNGILFFGIGAIIILLLTHGHVGFLVVVYSSNVFLTFSITLLGLSKYWFTEGRKGLSWLHKGCISALGCVICFAILAIIIVEKFWEGGLLSIIITTALIYGFYRVHRYYDHQEDLLEEAQFSLNPSHLPPTPTPKPLDRTVPTAVILLSGSRAIGMHTLLWIQRLFPNRYKQVVFLHTGIVDVRSFRGAEDLQKMKHDIEADCDFFIRYAKTLGLPAEAYADYGTNAVQLFVDLSTKANIQFSECVFFAGKALIGKPNFFTKLLDNDIANSVQERLHGFGAHMVILPLNLA